MLELVLNPEIIKLAPNSALLLHPFFQSFVKWRRAGESPHKWDPTVLSNLACLNASAFSFLLTLADTRSQVNAWLELSELWIARRPASETKADSKMVSVNSVSETIGGFVCKSLV